MSESLRVAFVVCVVAMISACSTLGGNSERGTQDLNAMLQQAEHAYSDGNLQHAQTLLETALKDDESNANAWYRLGTIYYRSEDYDRAADSFARAIKIDPRNAKAQFNLATIRLQQAEAHFQYFIATTDPNADITELNVLLGAIERYVESQK
ncbi:Hypothetical protein HDN1F_15540 [gamma proteobacterium HdN1]|nr:Hypothetical protein HDN1F_15540 [gamma proteobacterium HdN1]